MNRKAFTLIELLVVVSIISLLSSVVLSSLNTARDKARYVRMAQDLRQMEIALNSIYHDYGCWPRESTGGAGTCPTMPGAGSSETPIATYVAQSSGLGKYLKVAPTVPFAHDGNNYLYDNDNDAHNPSTCGTDSGQAYAGPSIFMREGSGNLDTAYAALNTVFDGDANPNTNAAMWCGKIRFSGGNTLLYGLSNTQ